jgi:lipoprotein-releasing system permease protein
MHVINIISGISMLGVFVGSAALIIILSVFNGFEKVILSMYSDFTPELKIEPRLGKTFNPETAYFKSLRKDPAVFSFTEVLQEKALIRYGKNSLAYSIVRGVSDDFLKNPQLDSTIQTGSFTLKEQDTYMAVIGSVLQQSLAVNVHDPFASLQVYTPKRNAASSADPINEFVIRSIHPVGIFVIQQDFDNMLVTPIEFTRELLNEPVNVSAIDVNFKPGTNVASMKQKLQDKIGKLYTIKDRNEQDPELYKTLNYERWFIFMILTFVLVIAIFNIIGSLTMLVIDKRKDIAILTSLGANKRLIKGIFFFEGMMISMIGCVAGMVLGLVFCLLQQHFGLVRFGGENTIINAYPVALQWTDFLLVFFTVSIIAVIASGISSGLSVKGLDEIKQDL